MFMDLCVVVSIEGFKVHFLSLIVIDGEKEQCSTKVDEVLLNTNLIGTFGNYTQVCEFILVIISPG